MINLKLLNRLQKDATVSMILRSVRAGLLEYYVVSTTINYKILVNGKCLGEIGDRKMVSIDVLLSSVMPLVEKGYELNLYYANNELSFVDDTGKMKISPLCVENITEPAMETVSQFMRFVEEMEKYDKAMSESTDKSMEVSTGMPSVRNMNLDGGQEDDTLPWTESVEEGKTVNRVEERQSSVKQYNLRAYHRIASAANIFNEVVQMYNDYSIVQLKNCYVLEKSSGEMQAINGKLLNFLINDNRGKGFFTFEDELVYYSSNKDKNKDNRANTFVFLTRYMPKNSVDDSILTKGTVLEKYVIDIQEELKVIAALRNKFVSMDIDMGAASVILTNERGETVIRQFEVLQANTISLNKMIKGEKVDSVEMSKLSIPKEVQILLPLLKGKVTVYVKRKKVIFQSDTFYIIFGR